MSLYQRKLYAPFIFYTRFGIGIFDQDWLEFRIKAFGAFTLPSVGGVLRPQDRWLVFIDQDMPLSNREHLLTLIDQSPARPNIRLVEVEFAFDIADRLELFLENEFKDDDSIYLARIDDDDAIRFDTIGTFIQMAQRIPTDSVFMYTTNALECYPVERIMLEESYENLLNVAFGTTNMLRGYARIGHTGLQSWATDKGFETVAHEGPHPLFLYNRHRQSSSRFASRRSHARTSEKSRKWAQPDFRAYNLDFDRVVEFRLYAGTAPYVQDGSLWVDSEQHTQHAAELRASLDEAKKQLTRTRVNLLKDKD